MHIVTRRAPARTSARRPALRPALLAAVAVLVALIGGACAPTTPTVPPPNPAGLRSTLRAEGIELAWTPTIAGQSAGYELQYSAPGVSWTSLPVSTDAHLLFTDVVPRTTYSFRVRTATVPGTTPATFSPTVTGFYVVPELPIIRIDTDLGAPILDKETYVHGSMTLDPNGSGYAAYSGTLGIKGRGNSTWFRPKKPYRIKLDTKSPMMGIASSKDWVLLANYDDKSQVRSMVASEISGATDLAWTPTYRPVEVVLNGQYLGVYSLTEAIKPASNRVDIEEMEPTDIAGEALTGGYLMEIDDRLEENNEPGWRTTKGVPVVVKDPDPMTIEQRSYIRQHVQKFEDSLFAPTYADPLGGYRTYLDVDAFVDHYLVQELTRNADSFWSSTYFSKQRGDDHLVFGPMWDFDHSMGSTWTTRPQPPDGWYTRGNGPWVRRLFTDPAFLARVGERWDQFQPAFAELPALIESLGAELRPAIDNDAARWNYTLGEADTPEYLSTWLTTRMTWIGDSLDAGV